jgi:hypothetical protein
MANGPPVQCSDQGTATTRGLWFASLPDTFVDDILNRTALCNMLSLTQKSQSLITSVWKHHNIRSLVPASSVAGGSGICAPHSDEPFDNGGWRFFSSSKHRNFIPRRRPQKNYRPVTPRGDKYQKKKGNKGFQHRGVKLHRVGDKIIELGDDDTKTAGVYDEDGLEAKFGSGAAEAFRAIQRERGQGRRKSVEDFLRAMDYFTSAEGSTEDLVGERRALAFEGQSEKENKQFLHYVEQMIEEERLRDLHEEDHLDGEWEDDGSGDNAQLDINDNFESINPNQLAFGEWGELVIRVDRNIKLWRGGRIESYRALVIGGKLLGQNRNNLLISFQYGLSLLNKSSLLS